MADEGRTRLLPGLKLALVWDQDQDPRPGHEARSTVQHWSGIKMSMGAWMMDDERSQTQTPTQLEQDLHHVEEGTSTNWHEPENDMGIRTTLNIEQGSGSASKAR